MHFIQSVIKRWGGGLMLNLYTKKSLKSITKLPTWHFPPDRTQCTLRNTHDIDLMAHITEIFVGFFSSGMNFPDASKSIQSLPLLNQMS